MRIYLAAVIFCVLTLACESNKGVLLPPSPEPELKITDFIEPLDIDSEPVVDTDYFAGEFTYLTDTERAANKKTWRDYISTVTDTDRLRWAREGVEKIVAIADRMADPDSARVFLKRWGYPDTPFVTLKDYEAVNDRFNAWERGEITFDEYDRNGKLVRKRAERFKGTLMFPAGTKWKRAPVTQGVEPKRTAYVVQPGDTLESLMKKSQIGARYAKEFLEINHKTDSTFVAGERIMLPINPFSDSERWRFLSNIFGVASRKPPPMPDSCFVLLMETLRQNYNPRFELDTVRFDLVSHPSDYPAYYVNYKDRMVSEGVYESTFRVYRLGENWRFSGAAYYRLWEFLEPVGVEKVYTMFRTEAQGLEFLHYLWKDDDLEKKRAAYYEVYDILAENGILLKPEMRCDYKRDSEGNITEITCWSRSGAWSSSGTVYVIKNRKVIDTRWAFGNS